jgi:hypothetical protein
MTEDVCLQICLESESTERQDLTQKNASWQRRIAQNLRHRSAAVSGQIAGQHDAFGKLGRAEHNQTLQS